jgi:hypothetical protein
MFLVFCHNYHHGSLYPLQLQHEALQLAMTVFSEVTKDSAIKSNNFQFQQVRYNYGKQRPRKTFHPSAQTG